MDPHQREQAILEELLKGNLPDFLRNLIPVKLQYQPGAGNTLTATIFVMPEYLAIGSDKDFLRIPMDLFTRPPPWQSGWVSFCRRGRSLMPFMSNRHFTSRRSP